MLGIEVIGTESKGLWIGFLGRIKQGFLKLATRHLERARGVAGAIWEPSRGSWWRCVVRLMGGDVRFAPTFLTGFENCARLPAQGGGAVWDACHLATRPADEYKPPIEGKLKGFRRWYVERSMRASNMSKSWERRRMTLRLTVPGNDQYPREKDSYNKFLGTIYASGVRRAHLPGHPWGAAGGYELAKRGALRLGD